MKNIHLTSATHDHYYNREKNNKKKQKKHTLTPFQQHTQRDEGTMKDKDATPTQH